MKRLTNLSVKQILAGTAGLFVLAVVLFAIGPLTTVAQQGSKVITDAGNVVVDLGRAGVSIGQAGAGIANNIGENMKNATNGG